MRFGCRPEIHRTRFASGLVADGNDEVGIQRLMRVAALAIQAISRNAGPRQRLKRQWIDLASGSLPALNARMPAGARWLNSVSARMLRQLLAVQRKRIFMVVLDSGA